MSHSGRAVVKVQCKCGWRYTMRIAGYKKTAPQGTYDAPGIKHNACQKCGTWHRVEVYSAEVICAYRLLDNGATVRIPYTFIGIERC